MAKKRVVIVGGVAGGATCAAMTAESAGHVCRTSSE
jgi:hypothetical protein